MQRAQPGAVLLRPEAADFGASCAEAEALGAVAVIFAAERGAERPFGYRHDRAPPGGAGDTEDWGNQELVDVHM